MEGREKLERNTSSETLRNLQEMHLSLMLHDEKTTQLRLLVHEIAIASTKGDINPGVVGALMRIFEAQLELLEFIIKDFQLEVDLIRQQRMRGGEGIEDFLRILRPDHKFSGSW